MTLELPKMKIPVIFPGDKKSTWVDLDEALWMGRLLFLFEEINNKVVGDFISLLLCFTALDEYEDIFIFINSRGGDIRSGITLFDTMVALEPDVNTSVLGLAASTASLILSGGSQRVGFPHARVMIHQPVISRFSASAERLASEVEEIFKIHNTMANIYAKITRKPVSVIQQDLERMKYMSVTEAKEYGILDKVLIEAVSKRYI